MADETDTTDVSERQATGAVAASSVPGLGADEDPGGVGGTAPNQGAAGDDPSAFEPESGESGYAAPPPLESDVNQGATGDAPYSGESHGESPLSVETESDSFAERPEVFVGAAFVGGLVVAQILKRLGPS
jgi:hypothetical protein